MMTAIGPDPDQIERWRMLAEEIRAYADNTRNPETGDTLRKIARQYDQLAERAERRLNAPPEAFGGM